jgi:hypothetical protein
LSRLKQYFNSAEYLPSTFSISDISFGLSFDSLIDSFFL